MFFGIKRYQGKTSSPRYNFVFRPGYGSRWSKINPWDIHHLLCTRTTELKRIDQTIL